jgi:hypothetical protein
MAERTHNLARINLAHSCGKSFAHVLLRNVIMVTVEASV